MKNNKLVLIGGGGHCKSVVEIIRNMNTYEVVGISDLKEERGKVILGIPVLYTDEDLPALFYNGVRNALIAVGSIGDASLRIKLFEKVKDIGFNFPIIISPYAVIAGDVKIGEGTAVMHRVVVNVGSVIGRNCILNTGCIVEHDCKIGDHVHVASGAVLSGGVEVGYAAHIGAGAVIKQGVKIGKRSVIGAGSVVVKDVPEDSVYVGVPARELVKNGGNII